MKDFATALHNKEAKTVKEFHIEPNHVNAVGK
jgi:hypothetical protein